MVRITKAYEIPLTSLTVMLGWVAANIALAYFRTHRSRRTRALACAHTSCRHPRAGGRFKHVRSRSCAVAGIVMDWPNHWVRLAKTCGQLLNFNCTLLLLPVARTFIRW